MTPNELDIYVRKCKSLAQAHDDWLKGVLSDDEYMEVMDRFYDEELDGLD